MVKPNLCTVIARDQHGSRLDGPGVCGVGQARPRFGIAQHALGPLLFRVHARRPVRARLMAAAVLAVSCFFLGLAAWMEPDPRGLGTHQQLGLPPCSSMMLLGYPCPTCGMTTAFSHAVRGRFFAAFGAQPAGFLLALVTAITAAASLSVVVSGRVWTVNWFRLSPTKLLIVVIAIVMGSWLYKLLVSQ